ncbi:hypothetical protein JOQ06_016952 [Pogonophryne albipinna]|uniref:Uncharacterized protein n=1 Tax=Pogonophryne albipinna TaxID=1090488 RepID=A0AAD6FJ78_9TELE|nr:hypothetical protein JOQ06_016952 [Pogonophryne albipinna]
MPSSSGVKCKSKQKNTSHEHGVISKTARDEGHDGVGIRRKSATPRLTGRYTPGLLEVMEDTAVNAIGAELAPSDELQGDCEDWDDRAMTDVDEPEMAIEVTELLMGQKQPKIPTISGIRTPVTQPRVRVTRLHSSILNAAAIVSAQSSSTSRTWPLFRTPVLLRNTEARRARRAVVPVAGKTSPRPSGSGRANTMRHITLPPSMEAVKRYQDPSNREVLSRFMCHDLRTANRYDASNPAVKEALGIRYMFQQSFAQATMDAQAEARIEPEAAGPSTAPAPKPERKPKAKRKTSSAPAQRKAGRAPAHCPEFSSSSSSDDELTLVYQDTTSDPSEDEADAEFQAGLLERANKREKEPNETLLDSADDDSDSPLESTCLSKTLQKQSR